MVSRRKISKKTSAPSFKEMVTEIMLSKWDTTKQRRTNKTSLYTLKKGVADYFGRDTTMDKVFLKRVLKNGVEKGWLEQIGQSYTFTPYALTHLQPSTNKMGHVKSYNVYAQGWNI